MGAGAKKKKKKFKLIFKKTNLIDIVFSKYKKYFKKTMIK